MQAPVEQGLSRSFSSPEFDEIEIETLYKHPVSEQRFRMGGRSSLTGPASAPPLGFFGLPIYGLFPAFRANIRPDALPRSTARHPE